MAYQRANILNIKCIDIKFFGGIIEKYSYYPLIKRAIILLCICEKVYESGWKCMKV